MLCSRLTPSSGTFPLASKRAAIKIVSNQVDSQSFIKLNLAAGPLKQEAFLFVFQTLTGLSLSEDC